MKRSYSEVSASDNPHPHAPESQRQKVGNPSDNPYILRVPEFELQRPEVEYLNDILKNERTLEQYNRTHGTSIRHPIKEKGDYFTDYIYEHTRRQVPLGKNIDHLTKLKPGCYMFVLTISNMYIHGPCTSDGENEVFYMDCCETEFKGWMWFRYRVVHPLLPGRGEKLFTAGVFTVDKNNNVYVLNDSGHYRPGPFTEQHAQLISDKFLRFEDITAVRFRNINSDEFCFTFKK